MKQALKEKSAGFPKRRKIKYLLKYTGISILAVIIIIIGSYLSGMRWFLYVGTIIALICVWIIAIINYETPLDKKAIMEAEKMVRKKKNKDLLGNIEEPEEIIEALRMKNEQSISLEEERKEKESDDSIEEIIRLRKEMKKIEASIKDLEDKKALYKEKISLLENEINVLNKQRKELKNKFIELI